MFCKHLRALFIIWAILIQFQCVVCKINGPPQASARKEDLKYVACEVCQHLALHVYDQAQDILSITNKKIDETAMIDLVEKVATSWRPEGEWITKLFLEIRSGGTLGVRDMGEFGVCGEACRTIERAAQDISNEHDIEIAEALYLKKYKSKKAFEKYLCTQLTKACTSTAPVYTAKDHKPYPAFKKVEPDAENVERMLGEMQDQGLRGSVHSREELMEEYLRHVEDKEL